MSDVGLAQYIAQTSSDLKFSSPLFSNVRNIKFDVPLADRYAKIIKNSQENKFDIAYPSIASSGFLEFTTSTSKDYIDTKFYVSDSENAPLSDELVYIYE